jgi:cell division protein FtsL
MENAQRIMQAYSQAPWRRQLQMVGLFLVSLALVALLAGIYLNVSARAATVGREIQFMQAEITGMQRQIADLESQLAALTSSGALAERAAELGLQAADPTQILYVVVPGYAPRRSADLAPPAGPPVASQPGISHEFSQSLLDWMGEQVRKIDLAQVIVEIGRR